AKIGEEKEDFRDRQGAQFGEVPMEKEEGEENDRRNVPTRAVRCAGASTDPQLTFGDGQIQHLAEVRLKPTEFVTVQKVPCPERGRSPTAARKSKALRPTDRSRSAERMSKLPEFFVNCAFFPDAATS